MRISDWSSDVCSSDLETEPAALCRAPGVVALEERIEHLLAQRRSNTRAVVGDVDLDRPVVSGTQGDRHLGAVLDGIIDNVADRARQNTRPAGPCEPPRPLVGDSVADVGELGADGLQDARQIDAGGTLRSDVLAQIIQGRSEEQTSELQSPMRISYAG